MYLFSLLALLAQATEPAADHTNLFRIIAGVLALACVVFIILRRKRKASKEEW